MAFLLLAMGAGGARGEEDAALGELRSQVSQAMKDNRADDVDNLIEIAVRSASAANAPLRMGRIELFAAELDADRPTQKTTERARKALLHLADDPDAKLALVRWHTSGAMAALSEQRLGSAALHLQEGRAALAKVLAPGAKEEGGRALGQSDPLHDQTRLDEVERGLLARLRKTVEEDEGDTSSLPAGTLAALSTMTGGAALKPDDSGDEPLPPKSRPSGKSLLGKLDRALSDAEEREVGADEARGEGKAAAAARAWHAETLLRMGKTADAVAARQKALAWYREHGNVDQVVVEARWIAERASGDHRAKFAARREEIREIERQLGKLWGPARVAAHAKHRAEYVALVEEAVAVLGEKLRKSAQETVSPMALLESVDLVRDHGVWDQAALLADGARWKRLAGVGAQVRTQLDAVARDDQHRAVDEQTLFDAIASPATQQRQRAINALVHGEAASEPVALDGAAVTARLAGRALVIFGRLDDQRLAIGVLPAQGAPKIEIANLAVADEERQVLALRRALREGGDGWHEPAKALYAALIAPIEEQLGSGAIVIPDGPLAAAPLVALEGEDQALLGASVALSLSGSLAELAAPKRAALDPNASLVLGVPRFTESGVLALPSADKEVATVKTTLEAAARKPKVLPPGTTPPQLLADGGRYDVVHLATRARLDGDTPLLGVLLFATAPLFTFDLGNAALRANVLVLDTPATQLDLPATAAARGLTGIAASALAATARTVVVATQSAEGVASAALFTRFYELYASGRSPAVALATAQREMAAGKLEQPLLLQAGADPIADSVRFTHPRFWAGFTLWGEP